MEYSITSGRTQTLDSGSMGALRLTVHWNGRSHAVVAARDWNHAVEQPQHAWNDMIQRIAKLIGCTSTSHVIMLKKHNGGAPITSIFDVNDGDHVVAVTSDENQQPSSDKDNDDDDDANDNDVDDEEVEEDEEVWQNDPWNGALWTISEDLRGDWYTFDGEELKENPHIRCRFRDYNGRRILGLAFRWPYPLLKLPMRDSDRCHWIVILCCGGAFAMGRWDSMTGQAMEHKTMRRYVLRARRGRRQANYAQGSEGARSAGSWIRMQQEGRLQHDIATVLQMDEWKIRMENAQFVFYHCPGDINRAYVFFQASPLHLVDSMRIQKIPFTVGKPTNTEVWRTARRLGNLLILDRASNAD